MNFTFIGSQPVRISRGERQKKLKGICDEFVTIASSYGFAIQDLVEELRQRGEVSHDAE